MENESKNPPFSENELKSFLATKKTLIVSAQQSTARAIRKLAMQMGTKADLTLTCSTFLEAKAELLAHPNHLLITDLFIDKDAGLDLIPFQEAGFPNRLEIATLVMCADPSSDSQAMLLEANVDAVLIKPFHFENFKMAMHQALQNKVKPSGYWSALERGKEHLKKDEIEQAIPFFEAAKGLDAKPTLSFFYLGEIQAKIKQYPNALKSFAEGLAFDEKDYRCLNAVFQVNMETSDYEAAYEVAKRIHKSYPVSPNRILDLVKISIYTRKFEDVIDYCEVFKKIEKQSSALSRTIVAAMLICAKYFHLKSDRVKALETLKKAADISLKTETLRLEVLRYFLFTGYLKEGEQYYSTLPDAVKSETEFRLTDLELSYASENFSAVIKLGGQLLTDGVKTERVFELLIESSKKLGRSATALQGLIDEAKLYFPKT